MKVDKEAAKSTVIESVLRVAAKQRAEELKKLILKIQCGGIHQ